MSVGGAGHDTSGNHDASTLKHYLRGIESFPAQKAEVASTAERNGALPDMVRQIMDADTERFNSPEEVMQAVQGGLRPG